MGDVVGAFQTASPTTIDAVMYDALYGRDQKGMYRAHELTCRSTQQVIIVPHPACSPLLLVCDLHHLRTTTRCVVVRIAIQTKKYFLVGVVHVIVKYSSAETYPYMYTL